MIVKLIIHQKLDAISIWNKDGDRLYYSDKEADIEMAKKLLTVIREKTDAELAAEVMGEVYPEGFFNVQRMTGYFNAKWNKGIVNLMKRTEGYNW